MATTASLLMFLTVHGLGSALGLLPAQDKSTQDSSTDKPILDYDVELTMPKSKQRREKDNRFKGAANPDNSKPIAELPLGIWPLPLISHWWIGLSALPVEQSDIVVLGDIVSREAHLSDDRTGIYSEFTVQIGEVLKDETGLLDGGSLLSVNRRGGGVRFASGKIQKYGYFRQGMPQTGSRYVLFLQKSAQGDLLILTGYELSGVCVTPLDEGENEDRRSDLPFAKYRGAGHATFLEELRTAIAQQRTLRVSRRKESEHSIRTGSRQTSYS